MSRGPHPVHEGGGMPTPLDVPPCHVSPLMLQHIHLDSIYSLSGRKNQREGVITFYDTEPPPSPKLS